MKKQIKSFFTTNIGWKVVSLFIGFFIWAMLSNAQDPSVTRTVDIPINYRNTVKLLQDENLEVVSKPESVQVNVTVRESNVNKLRPELFRCTADLIDHKGGDLTEQRVHINVTQIGGKDFIIDWGYFKNDPNITVEMDNHIEKVFNIELLTEGSMGEEAVLENSVVFTPEFITVSGPKSRFGNLRSVKAVVNLDKLSEQGGFISTKVPLALYDSNDNLITNEDGFLKLSEEKVTMTAMISRIQRVKLELEGVTGEPEDGYRYVGYSFNPESIGVRGLKNDLTKFKTLRIPEGVIDITGLNEDKTFSLDVTPFLPENTKVVGDESTVEVTVKIEKLNTVDFVIPEESIEFVGASEDYRYKLSKDLSVTIAGLSEDLEILDGNKVKTVIDVSGLKEGEHTVKAEISVPSGYTMISDNKPEVTLIVSLAEDDTTEESSSKEESKTEESTKESTSETESETESQETTEESVTETETETAS